MLKYLAYWVLRRYGDYTVGVQDPTHLYRFYFNNGRIYETTCRKLASRIRPCLDFDEREEVFALIPVTE